MIKYQDSPKHNQTTVKVCDTCKEKYHPRRNGYEISSRFCSVECTRRARKKTGGARWPGMNKV